METQLQEVLGLWESAAGDARSEAASEVADLRKQLEESRARLADADDARRAQEVKLRSEVDQIMRLWEEAQSTNGAEVEHLQERILELKQQLADTKARLRKVEGSLEEYSF
jgi:chromosome segregation ATPase